MTENTWMVHIYPQGQPGLKWIVSPYKTDQTVYLPGASWHWGLGGVYHQIGLVFFFWGVSIKLWLR